MINDAVKARECNLHFVYWVNSGKKKEAGKGENEKKKTKTTDCDKVIETFVKC
jgi:hypothetical protein